MKKALAILMCGVMAISLSACGKDRKEEPTTQAQSTTVATTTQHEESTTAKRANLKNVKPVTNDDGDIVLTCPAEFFDEQNPPSAELTDEQKQHGIKKAVVNKDGTLSYIVNRKDYENVKTTTLNEIKTTFDSYSKQIPVIKRVVASEDYAVVNVTVDAENFMTDVNASACIWEIGLNAQMAQVILGVVPDNLSVDVVITDAQTGEVVNAVHYPTGSDK